MSKAWICAVMEWKEILWDFYVQGILVLLEPVIVETLLLLTYSYPSLDGLPRP